MAIADASSVRVEIHEAAAGAAALNAGIAVAHVAKPRRARRRQRIGVRDRSPGAHGLSSNECSVAGWRGSSTVRVAKRGSFYTTL
jgi:hypothetical protein